MEIQLRGSSLSARHERHTLKAQPAEGERMSGAFPNGLRVLLRLVVLFLTVRFA